MTALLGLEQNQLEKLSLKDYFRSIELGINKALSVEQLSDFFTVQPYVENKPYLIRRRLIPTDTRFKEIEVVYKDSSKVEAIVWNLTTSLSQLTDIFGEPLIHNEPYSDSTVFAFKSKNQDVDIIKTRYHKWLTRVKDKKAFVYQDEDNQKVELEDPEFSFIQFDLRNND